MNSIILFSADDNDVRIGCWKKLKDEIIFFLCIRIIFRYGKRNTSFDSIRFPKHKWIRAIVSNFLCCMNSYFSVKRNIIVIVHVFQRLSKHFTIKVLSSWERTVEVCSICFGEVPCMLWVSDTNMTGVFDDIEFVDEAVIQTI